MADTAPNAIETYTTPLFRASYPNLDKATKMEGSEGEPKFGITQLYTAATFTPQDIERWKKMRMASLIVLRDKFGMKAFSQDKKPLPYYKMPFRDGMEKPDKEGYGTGVTFVRATNKAPPGMIKIVNGEKIRIGHEVFYAGCWCRASVSFWAFDNKSKGVGVNLHNLIYVGDGPRFGPQGPAAENDFTDLGEDEISFGDTGGEAGISDDEISF